MRSTVPRGAARLSALAIGCAAIVEAQVPSEPRLPDSAQGRVVRPFKAWASVMLEVRNEDYGAVRIDRVFAVHETVLVALVQGDKGRWMDFRFEFEPKGSPRLTRIRLEPSDPPR